MDVADILSELDDHGFEDSSEERKLSALNDAYQDVLSREAWPFLEMLERSANLTLSDDVIEASEPIRAVLFFRCLSRTIVPIQTNLFLEQYGNRLDQAGTPWMYYFIGNDLHVWPVPATMPSDTTLYYIRRAEDLEANTGEDDIVLPREYHRDILVNGALYKLYALEDDAELASGFQQYFETAIRKMSEFAWKKQYQAHPIVEFPSW